MEWLQSILDNSTMPVVTAFVLGLLTAVSPCPMATNITAIGYVGRHLDSRRKMFLSGILYTLGRMLAYTLLGAVLIYMMRCGKSLFHVQQFLSRVGEAFLPPCLIIIGVIMLVGSRLRLPGINFSIAGKEGKMRGLWGSVQLGVIFALAFCPTSGLLYFGMLLPMSAAETGGYLLPVVYAIATGLPVVIVSWLLAYCISGVGIFYGKMQVLQKWLNVVVAVVFIVVGVYYGLIYLSLI